MNSSIGQIPEHAQVPVQVVDLSSLRCIDATATNFTKSGCRILDDNLQTMSDAIGLRVPGLDHMVRAHVVNSSSDSAELAFLLKGEPTGEKRKERRRSVQIPARASAPDQINFLDCKIVDASQSGCRLQGENIGRLPDDILLLIKGLDLPVKAFIVWRRGDQAGVRLLWQFSKSADVPAAPVDRRSTDFGTRQRRKPQGHGPI